MDPTFENPAAELRSRLGLTQQEFAHRLGISIRAVANYDSGKPPNSKSLSALQRLANEAGEADLAATFEAELSRSLGLEDIGSAFSTTKEVLKSLTAWVKGKLGPVDFEPPVFRDDIPEMSNFVDVFREFSDNVMEFILAVADAQDELEQLAERMESKEISIEDAAKQMRATIQRNDEEFKRLTEKYKRAEKPE